MISKGRDLWGLEAEIAGGHHASYSILTGKTC